MDYLAYCMGEASGFLAVYELTQVAERRLVKGELNAMLHDPYTQRVQNCIDV